MTIPIRVRKVDERHFGVKGTPTDCALLAIYEFIGGRPPTVLLSGINRAPISPRTSLIPERRRRRWKGRCSAFARLR
jgi:hypothetical protein